MAPLRDLLLSALATHDPSSRLFAAHALALACLCTDSSFTTDLFRQFEVLLSLFLPISL